MKKDKFLISFLFSLLSTISAVVIGTIGKNLDAGIVITCIVVALVSYVIGNICQVVLSD